MAGAGARTGAHDLAGARAAHRPHPPVARALRRHGWPIVGDASTEPPPRSGGPALHLHSREVVVPLYKNREPIRVSAPVPLHMQERLYACGWTGEVFRLVDAT